MLAGNKHGHACGALNEYQVDFLVMVLTWVVHSTHGVPFLV